MYRHTRHTSSCFCRFRSLFFAFVLHSVINKLPWIFPACTCILLHTVPRITQAIHIPSGEITEDQTAVNWYSSWFWNACIMSVASQSTSTALLSVKLWIYLSVCALIATCILLVCCKPFSSIDVWVGSLVQVCMSKCFWEREMTLCRCGS